ncbi:hypothetical protein Pve01_45300 [Planomonospora venezuelensis]|nr:hypothetical protein Pve01_45300 [Planomonospora venezuelensis]
MTAAVISPRGVGRRPNATVPTIAPASLRELVVLGASGAVPPRRLDLPPALERAGSPCRFTRRAAAHAVERGARRFTDPGVLRVPTP